MALAHCVAESFLRHHPDGRFHVLLVDTDELPEGFGDERVSGIRVADINLRAYHSMRARYSNFELCNALKPSLLLHLLNELGEERVLYLDSDLYITASLVTEAYEKLGHCSILLTPHLYRVPSTQEAYIQRDLAILQGGTLNGGFVGARRTEDAIRVLEWWQSRLETTGYYQLDRGMNCDQRWLDFAVGFQAGIQVLHHPGLNVAYWNLSERELEFDGHQHSANGERLLFFHFSGFRLEDTSALTKNWTRFSLANRPDLVPLTEEYRVALQRSTDALRSAVAPRSVESSELISSPSGDPDSHVQHDGRRPTSNSMTVVMVTPNSDASAADNAIRGVLAQNGVDIEVVVVFTDPDARSITTAYGDHPRVGVMRLPGAGLIEAKNVALRRVRAPFVTFLVPHDAATDVDASQIASAVALLATNPTAAFSYWRTLEAPDEADRRRTDTSGFEVSLRDVLETPFGADETVVWRTETARSAGGFDPAASPVEDIDLSWRLLSAGHGALQHERAGTPDVDAKPPAAPLALARALAIEQAIERLFAHTDLTDDVRGFERKARYQAAIEVATFSSRIGDHTTMTTYLAKSAVWSDDPIGVLPEKWKARFAETFERGQPDESARPNAVTRAPEWQTLASLRPLALLTRGIRARPTSPMSRIATARPGDRTSPLWQNLDIADGQNAQGLPRKLDLRGELNRTDASNEIRYAVAALEELHDANGVHLDSHVEHTFLLGASTVHQRPWVGFLHSAPECPPWYETITSAERLATNTDFLDSLPNCVGLFAFSETLANWWSAHINVPVVAIGFPTRTPTVNFSVDAFAANPQPRLVQIGSWLRKLHSIQEVPVQMLRRSVLHRDDADVRTTYASERRVFGLEERRGLIDTLPEQDDYSYDELLRSNIVYADLYGASADTTVLDCIARATPLLINPLPAVKEYLGEAYPLYFASRVEAARKAEDPGCIRAAHEYLLGLPQRQRLSGASFASNVAASPLYTSIRADE